MQTQAQQYIPERRISTNTEDAEEEKEEEEEKDMRNTGEKREERAMERSKRGG